MFTIQMWEGYQSVHQTIDKKANKCVLHRRHSINSSQWIMKREQREKAKKEEGWGNCKGRGVWRINYSWTVKTKKKSETHKDTCTHRQETVSSGCESKANLVPTEQKVHSQGRMLGYLFFSLLSSLLASSYIPWALPPGKDYKTKLQLDSTTPVPTDF